MNSIIPITGSSLNAFLVAASVACAQPSDGTLSTHSGYGARASAFAGAYATETNDVTTMYWNPSSIAFINRPSVVWNYYQSWDGRTRSELAAVPVLSGYSGVIGIGVNAVQHFVKDQRGVDQPEFIYGADAAAGIRLSPTFSAGLSWSLKHHSYKTARILTATSAIGVLYVPGPEISYAMVYSGIGNTVRYDFQPDRVTLYRKAVPKTLLLGIAMRFPASQRDRLLTIALSNEKTFSQTGIRYSGAMEWTIMRSFDLRTGYVVAPSYAGAKYGAGFRTGPVRLDYAISPSALMKRYQELTASWFF